MNLSRRRMIANSPFAGHVRWFLSHAIPVALLTAAAYLIIGIPTGVVYIFLNR